MNEPGPFDQVPSHMSDEELIRELQHWGERQDSPTAYSALSIQRRSNKKRRTAIRWALFACTVMAVAISCIARLANSRLQPASPREIVMETTPVVPDPKLWLKSFEQRTQDIESRIEGLNSRWEQQRQAATEIQELNATLLNYERVVIRNAIVLSQIP